MLSAAASWDGLAAELDAAARSFTAVTTGLADGAWQGAAMLAMARAAAPYVTWLTTSATRAGQTAAQARAAASAFESVQSAIVHPMEVAANRSGLVSLVATNLFGQNFPAIAAAEAAYGFQNRGNWNVGLINVGNRLLGYGLPGDGNIGVSLIDLSPVGGGSPTTTAILMGGTGPSPLPWSGFQAFANSFITPTHPSYGAQFLVTPSKLFPITGPTSLTFDTSIAEGMQRLNSAIMNLHAAGKDAVVFGLSQSSTVATLEMRYLQSLPAALRPGTDELSFVLVANPNRPDGGLLSRFTGLSIPLMGFTFNGATPANLYPTVDYAIQYDGAADFPQYPLNLLATANALAGFAYIHPSYALSAAQFASGVVQPVSPDSLTTYILIPTHDLPLLNPLRAIPFVGNPLADLVQPDLRVLVELGYDRTAYQDVPTPAGLFPHVDPAMLAAQLQQGAVQGVSDALGGLGWPVRLP